MNTEIQNTTMRRDHPILTWSLHILLGSLFLVGCSQIEFPISPVPITLQTLGFFLLALFQGSQKSFFFHVSLPRSSNCRSTYFIWMVRKPLMDNRALRRLPHSLSDC